MTETDRQQIAELFQRYGAGIGRYVLLRVGNPELAEEITARVFLAVVRHIHQQKGAVVGWLWAILRTELSRHFRQRRHQPIPLDVAASNGAPGEELEQQERDELLYAALQQLPEEAQQLVSLKFFFGASNVEIAQAMGWTPSNVGVKVHRVLKTLRVLLRKPLAMDATLS